MIVDRSSVSVGEGGSILSDSLRRAECVGEGGMLFGSISCVKKRLDSVGVKRQRNHHNVK